MTSLDTFAGNILSGDVSCLPGPEVTLPKIVTAGSEEIDQLAFLIQEKIGQIHRFVSDVEGTLDQVTIRQFQNMGTELQNDLLELRKLKGELNQFRTASVYEFLSKYPEYEKKLEAIKTDIALHLKELISLVDQVTHGVD